MRMLTVRLPEAMVAEIEAESRLRNVSRSVIVRERLQRTTDVTSGKAFNTLELIRDLVGSVEGLPSDLSSRKKHYLKTRGYGQNRHRR